MLMLLQVYSIGSIVVFIGLLLLIKIGKININTKISLENVDSQEMLEAMEFWNNHPLHEYLSLLMLALFYPAYIVKFILYGVIIKKR